MLLRIGNIKIPPSQPEDSITSEINNKYGLGITSFKILKKSLDARNKHNIFYSFRVLIEVNEEEAARLLRMDDIDEYILPVIQPAVKRTFGEKIIIIGSGPAGLFAALRLIEAGAEVLILERGKPVEERMKDIERLELQGILDPDSNSLFGEGGAGTYSDGKLTTRINRPEIIWFYKKLVENGAPESVAYESKPHVGTDRLQEIVKNIRKTITASGSQVKFGERVTDLYISGNRITGVATSADEYFSGTVVLATGHSARDVYYLLKKKGIALEKKGFAAGVRIEHPAGYINRIQYGESQYLDILPPADYTLAYNNRSTGRGIYSFCMCPGGMVINSSSENGGLCVNGMSMSGRNYMFSNSAIVVTVNKDDTGPDPLSGIDLQRQIEEKAFFCGGGSFNAPVQGIISFLKNSKDKEIWKTSYRNGVTPARLEDFLPVWITDEIRGALPHFNRKMKGIISHSGVFIGAETRTSSPVRITRGAGYESISVHGLFPVGEGSGYSGGIVSSAVDGIKCADVIKKILK